MYILEFMNFFIFTILTIPALFASDSIAKGQPTEWQIGFQEAGSPLMQQLIDFHDFFLDYYCYYYFCILTFWHTCV